MANLYASLKDIMAKQDRSMNAAEEERVKQHLDRMHELERRITGQKIAMGSYINQVEAQTVQPIKLEQMLSTRMRMTEREFIQKFKLVAVRETSSAVFVILMGPERPIVLEDDASLFPSDKLTTQLRLIQQER